MFSSNFNLRSLKKFQSSLLISSVTSKSLTTSHQLTKPTKETNSRKLRQKYYTPKPQQLNKKQQHNEEEPKLYTSEKISKVYTILKYSTWDSAQQQLESLPIKWDSYTVNQVLKTHPPMQKSWLFFNWASSRKNFRHDQYTYTTMMDIFGEAGRIESMMHVFRQMKENGVTIDVVTCTSLMHWLSKGGDLDGAVKLWEDMKKNAGSCRPTVVSYTAYMKILFDHKRVDQASEVYRKMLESGVKPNCHTYTVLMEYLASSGKLKEAMEIFDKMQDAGVRPDKATCNILIDLCCNTRETWAIMKILQYMKENSLVLRYHVYEKALESFNRAGESDNLLKEINRQFSAERIYDYTDKSDILPPDSDLFMDNGLVLNLLNRKNLIAIDSLLAQMINKRVRLETGLVSEIIGVNNGHRRPKGALLAYDYSMKMGIDINKSAYLVLIGSLIRTSSYSKVVEIVENMIKQGTSLGTHLNSLLIHRLGLNKLPLSAVKLFESLPDSEKSTAEYTALTSAYFSSGNVEKGLETFRVMKSRGVKVALGTYCVLVNGLERCGGNTSELGYCKKEKMRLEAEMYSQNLSMEETICNILFAGNFKPHHVR